MYQIYRFCRTSISYVHRRSLPSKQTFLGPNSCFGCKYSGGVRSAKQVTESMDNKPIWSPRSRAGLEPHASIKVIWVTRVANKLLERLKLGEPVAGCIGHPQNGEVIRSQDFEMGCELVKKVHNHNDKVDMSGKLEAYFVDKCEKISSSELTSLLHFLLELNKNEERWSYQAKELFYLLEREMCRRLYSCFQEKLHKNEDFFKFAEKNIHLMLEYEVGYKLFMAYTRYCMFDFSSAVSLENLPLLLLSTIRVLDRSYVLFSLLEDFVLRNYDHLDINTLSFFCVSSLICSHPITSCQLLDQLGTTLMCQLQSSLMIMWLIFSKVYNFLATIKCPFIVILSSVWSVITLFLSARLIS